MLGLKAYFKVIPGKFGFLGFKFDILVSQLNLFPSTLHCCTRVVPIVYCAEYLYFVVPPHIEYLL
jgi:hypothetical protein